MGEFFKGWRRKVGLLMLVLALAFMGGWVRSLMIVDSAISANRGTGHSLVSADGKIELRIDHDAKVDITIGVRSQPLDDRRKIEEVHLKRQQALRTRLAKLEDTKATLSPRQSADLEDRIKRTLALTTMKQLLWAVPYWSIVTPLTLISLWLLLFKPRPRTPTKLIEPISETVA